MENVIIFTSEYLAHIFLFWDHIFKNSEPNFQQPLPTIKPTQDLTVMGIEASFANNMLDQSVTVFTEDLKSSFNHNCLVITQIMTESNDPIQHIYAYLEDFKFNQWISGRILPHFDVRYAYEKYI